ncbi:MAG TPA: SDR family NAD(P)-dependent oxidoreductase [Opitutaceae bacterium]|nr:SDR family NAD(P)-dependent oxidoreductase [Opitutaceae bacterium]
MSATRLSVLYPTAFVTGASAGLGRAFAAMLLTEGVRVWGTARDASRLGELTARHPQLFTAVPLDLADAPGATAGFRRAAEAAGGGFDLVVQNAGFGGAFGEFPAGDFAAWRAQLDAMLVNTAQLSHEALRGMRARDRGCLVHISSIAGEFPLPFMSGYNVVKAGLSALSESLIFETRGTGVTVVDFRPGDYRTAFNQAMQASTTAPAAADPRLARAWLVLETHLEAAPPPVRAAADLRRALLRRKSGIVRSGSFFQAQLAPLLARLAPKALVREATARYFGS